MHLRSTQEIFLKPTALPYVSITGNPLTPKKNFVLNPDTGDKKVVILQPDISVSPDPDTGTIGSGYTVPEPLPRVLLGHETVADPPPGRPVAADVREPCPIRNINCDLQLPQTGIML